MGEPATGPAIPRYPVGPLNHFGRSALTAFTGVRTEPMQFLVPPLAVIVEDDRLQRDTLADALASENIDVIHCSTAAAAELLVSRIGPELRLLVTDLWLSNAPVGAELAR